MPTLLQLLLQIIRPFLLRRLKEDVAGELPAKVQTVQSFRFQKHPGRWCDQEQQSCSQVERTVRCQLSAYQQALSDILQEGVSRQGLKGVSINNTVMELRNICNHPFISRLHVQVCLMRGMHKWSCSELPTLRSAASRGRLALWQADPDSASTGGRGRRRIFLVTNCRPV